jgi:CelD/BcsL family acetyltransferase involved in cellulose biosynthesis
MEQWRELRPQWNEMLANSPANQLFMTWEWLDCWLRVQPAKDLFVICVHGADDKLLGVAPLYKADYTLLKVLPYRVLRVIGDVDSGAEYQTWFARALDEDAAYTEIVRTLQALRGEWDLIWMPNVGSWFGSHEAIVRAAESGRLQVRTRPRGFSTVKLPENYDTYLARMSPNRRQQVRRNTKKFLSKSGVEIRQVATQEDLGPALAALFFLHDKRRRSVDEEGVFDRNPREREFYERFARVALDKGWLAMFVLYDHAEPKAVQIGYIYNGVLLQMQEGFDPDYLPHAGNALRAWAIQRCIQRGLTEYDFLGGHSEHKRRWLATERTGMDLLSMHSGIKNLPLRIGVWPTGKYLRPS